MAKIAFTEKQIEQAKKDLVILVDSREQKNGHILEYLDKTGIAYRVGKLSYGDYSFLLPEAAQGHDLTFCQDIVIERKASLEELSGNLTRERERFDREFLRAKADGCKAYLMIEDPGGYSAVIGHKYRTQMNPQAFMASLKTWEGRFDANVQFIDRQHSGYFILSTFQYYLRQLMK
ncbi:MAG: ERCC4 domain-containing protein [Lachnospiraceae bacterium]|nr:ERCC4 domain-containing protein [Lachnospiraceae bacterium]